MRVGEPLSVLVLHRGYRACGKLFYLVYLDHATRGKGESPSADSKNKVSYYSKGLRPSLSLSPPAQNDSCPYYAL